ncbi:MAG: GNAT family N-acetyltransferase [Planctomycetes bacterium]|nr:GNAT family N-acetyltransferase [Planctomycetota bacterium]
MNIVIEHEMPTADIFCSLKKSVSWPTPEIDDASDALSGTLFGVVAKIDGQAVAMGRIVGDGALCFSVQDLIVHPDYQRQGIGRRLMDELMLFIKTCARSKARITLFSAPGLQGFYDQYGFIERPGNTNAPGMIYTKE